MWSTAASSMSGPISVPGSSGFPIGTCAYDAASLAVMAGAMLLWRNTRRVLVQRCPAVPTAPNRTARVTRSGLASSMTMMPLLPPSSSRVRPRRAPTTSATRRPMRHDPVALMSGNRRSASMRSPISESLPMISRHTPFQPCRSSTRSTIASTATAVSGVLRDGFQTTQSPHTIAISAFQLHTATGKLKAVMTPVTPSGCHCSYMRWPGRSLCMVSP